MYDEYLAIIFSFVDPFEEKTNYFKQLVIKSKLLFMGAWIINNFTLN
jgi:hypothetical protein